MIPIWSLNLIIGKHCGQVTVKDVIEHNLFCQLPSACSPPPIITLLERKWHMFVINMWLTVQITQKTTCDHLCQCLSTNLAICPSRLSCLFVGASYKFLANCLFLSFSFLLFLLVFLFLCFCAVLKRVNARLAAAKPVLGEVNTRL